MAKTSAMPLAVILQPLALPGPDDDELPVCACVLCASLCRYDQHAHSPAACTTIAWGGVLRWPAFEFACTALASLQNAVAGGGLWGGWAGALHTLQGIHERLHGVCRRRSQVPLQHLRPPQPHVRNRMLGTCMQHALLLMLSRVGSAVAAFSQRWTAPSACVPAGQTATSASWALTAGVLMCTSGRSCAVAPSNLSPHQSTW